MLTNLHPDMTVGEVVAQHYRTAEVFKRHGIDFCCGGKKTLNRACADSDTLWETLADELSRALESPEMPSQNADTWDLAFLADFIVHTHHRYLRENLPLLCEYTAKISTVHGKRHPELNMVKKQVELLTADLLEHLQKEENMLFPYIKTLCTIQENHRQAPAMPFGPVQNPIRIMEDEHDYAGSLLDNLRELTGDFTPPEDACTTYRVAFAKLKELDDDLRWHVHLENNVLFPKVILLEQMLCNQN